MTRNPSRTATDEDGEGFDLSNIFIGREQQLDLFKMYLHSWKGLISKATAVDNDTQTISAPSPTNKIQGLVVLLYGRGGFGKSTLLRRYRDIVLQENEASLASKVIASGIIDWENAAEGRRGLFNLTASKEIDAPGYFKMLCTQLAGALGKKVDDFKQYQRAVRAVEEAHKQARQVIDSMPGDERFAPLRGLVGEGVVTLLRLVPYTGAFLNNQQIAETVKGVVGEGVDISAKQVLQLHAKLQDRLGAKFSDYLEPDLKLGLSLGYDLRELARNYPLLIFFDTYEEIDEGDRLLRIVMGAAGLRVGWVIGGRDNLWAGLDQRLRSKGIEYGYKEIVPADRGKDIDFNAGGIGAFTPSDLKEYFDVVGKRVQFDSPLPQLRDEDVQRIWDATKGIPLAVRIAASIYLDTANVGRITEDVKGKHDIVDQMVRRYLLHVRDDERDRAKLYGLAMLRRADQPAAIIPVLNLTQEQARTGDYAMELSRLHRRYSFIFTEKEEPALHQEVRHFLRLWLLEHRIQPEIMAINERLKDAHEQALQVLEKRRQYSTLKERLQDDEWAGIYLDLVEQQFWIEPVEGVRTLLSFMLAAAIYRRNMNKEAYEIGKFFEAQIGSPYSTWWAWASQSLIYLHSSNLSSEELHGLEELERLLKQQRQIFAQPLSAYRNELEAALWWRLGEAYTGKDDHKALKWYEKALTRLGEEIELREGMIRACWNIAYKLYEEKKYVECISFLDRAISLDPNNAAAYYNRGLAYANQEQYEQAIADCTQAITLDPKYARAYHNRGLAYANQEQYEQAIGDYTQAITLDRKDAVTYYNRGNAYYNQRQYEQAIGDYTQAIALDPKDAVAYYNRGLAYLWLGNTIQAGDEFRNCYKLAPTDINVAWMAEWAGMGKQRVGQEVAARLEEIARIDPKHYVANVCRGVALGLRGRLKEGLEEIERAISIKPAEGDAYFWKGMLCAYYYRGQSHDREAMEVIEKALEVRLPPVLLMPLYWLEQDRPDFFARCARPLLE